MLKELKKIMRMNKKAMEAEVLIKVIILIVLFATIGAAIIFLLKRFGVI